MTSLLPGRASALAIAFALFGAAACGGKSADDEPPAAEPVSAEPSPTSPACASPQAAPGGAAPTRLQLSRVELGAAIAPLFTAIFGTPGIAWSDRSYLQLGPDGSGLLFLVDPKGAMVRVPLREARVTSSDGRRGTLAAVVPLSALLGALRTDLAAFSPEYCDGDSVDAVATKVRAAADSALSPQAG
ncbi:MAG TPA: hypothetical protein VLT33_40185, partial [Labilithrix sp.]|nr:hypothetical protein [Labilithrix sp.]